MVDAAERLRRVRIFEADFAGLHVLRAGDVLRSGKLLEPEIGGAPSEHVQLARRVVDQRSRIVDDESVALAASNDGAGEIVDVGEIVPIGQLPVRGLVFEIEMEALTAIHM